MQNILIFLQSVSEHGLLFYLYAIIGNLLFFALLIALAIKGIRLLIYTGRVSRPGALANYRLRKLLHRE